MNAKDIEGFIRKGANLVGIDIHRYRIESTEWGQRSTMLRFHGVDLVLDVGANVGQFARGLRRGGYQGRIVSFEPLPSAHAELLRASQFDPKWEIAPRVALGDHEGMVSIHVAGNSVSSSVLNMLDTHAAAASNSVYVGTQTAPMSRLDTMLSCYLTPETVPFLKVDTQGYEDRVLDGARELLSRAKGLQLELSFVPLYEGQKLFDALVGRLQALGFSIWAIWPGFSDPSTGRMLQIDAAFFRD